MQLRVFPPSDGTIGSVVLANRSSTGGVGTLGFLLVLGLPVLCGSEQRIVAILC